MDLSDLDPMYDKPSQAAARARSPLTRPASSLSASGVKATELLSLPNVSARRIKDGKSESLIDSTLLRLETVETRGDAFLLISLGGEIEFPVSARTAVSKQGRAYLISSQDGNGFIRLELPDRGISPDQIELFDAALSSWTAFESTQNHEHRGRLVLVDETTGSVVADLSSDMPITQDISFDNDSDAKEPVVVQVSDNGRVRISPLHLTAGFGRSDSKIIKGAEYVSRGIIVASDKLSRKMDARAQSYVASRPATDSPLVFSPAAKTGVRGVHGFTNQAVKVSGKTVDVVGRFVGRVGAKIGQGVKTASEKFADSDEEPEEDDGTEKQPGKWKDRLNKSLVAFNTLTDSLEASGKHVLSSGHDASVRVTQHRYGEDAGEAVASVGSAVGNVGLVYIDARGIGRRALLTNTGKAAIKAQMTDGKQVILQPDSISGTSTPTKSLSRTASPAPPIPPKPKQFAGEDQPT